MLDPGQHEVRIEADGFRTKHAAASLEAGGEVEVTFVLEAVSSTPSSQLAPRNAALSVAASDALAEPRVQVDRPARSWLGSVRQSAYSEPLVHNHHQG